MIRADQLEDPQKGLLGRRAVPEHQKLPQPASFLLAPVGDFLDRVTIGQHRGNGQSREFPERHVAFRCSAGVDRRYPSSNTSGFPPSPQSLLPPKRSLLLMAATPDDENCASNVICAAVDSATNTGQWPNALARRGSALSFKNRLYSRGWLLSRPQVFFTVKTRVGPISRESTRHMHTFLRHCPFQETEYGEN